MTIAEQLPSLRLIATLTWLEELREGALNAQAALMQRLLTFMETTTVGQEHPLATHQPESSLAESRSEGRIRTLLRVVADGVILAPSMLHQARKITRLVRPGSSCLVVNIASNRLAPPRGVKSVREYLVSLTTALPPPGSSPGESAQILAEKVFGAQWIYLFDPLPRSAFWGHRRVCWPDDVFVIDGTYLAATFVAAFLMSPFQEGRRVFRELREWRAATTDVPGPPKPRLSKVLCVLAAGIGYRKMVAPFERTEAIFFTSNSTLTEVLRSQHLQDHACEAVYEIMHGVGSVPVERFFATVLREARDVDHPERHVFVPQIPGLPLYGVFRNQVTDSVGREIAVNAFLNDYVLKRSADGRAFRKFIAQELEKVCPGPIRSEPLIITIMGGPSTGQRAESPFFRAECFLIELTSKFCRAARRNSTILYVPHPTRRSDSFRNQTFLRHDVHLCRDSTLSWWISDLCVSLMSSALFEAAYFGVRGFTPSIESDGVFPQSYLDLVAHPPSASREDMVAAFDAFLEGGIATPFVDPITKAARRFAITGLTWAS